MFNPVKDRVAHAIKKVKKWLQSLLLPISTTTKGVLWAVLFGLAKTCQYSGLTILGVEGYNQLKRWVERKKAQ